ncbi:uncharacterized protein K460DRAFT_273980 [Cucurbitaria berberidis CBS 394.84]|uniref:Methyltransferase domain-containing protein n=1 Tax=Cucurbitaria berberidis CBS 394.84 TaxID=1168544 RepID=A0A9P4GQK5_9PLEO|nr:uncharacterized protein K460DRAFT_273980 [Cucurbitaria berberidis CBS 394.84]KAF1850893.1 hypothetical protein K460DRAFT_273980 [Cucurbitaria berberidis CBS 394.84]
MDTLPIYVLSVTVAASSLYVAHRLYAHRHLLRPFLTFALANFVHPISENGLKQQDALENFYKIQARIYDITRTWLLHGREDMLILVAAQLKYQAGPTPNGRKPIWIDIGGGTGWNIEAMAQYLDVPTFFEKVYLVDLSPSLLAVARDRFERLGWTNVQIVCQDALDFCLTYKDQADLITLSYSLSMLPNFNAMIDAFADSLSESGVLAVVDFYVQSRIDTQGRNFTGGVMNRHVNWLGRTFWRTWFELDRISLEGARRDYLEYRFGTLKCLNQRNHIFGTRIPVAIPYYIFLGRLPSSSAFHDNLKRTDAACTGAPHFNSQVDADICDSPIGAFNGQSKVYQAARENLTRGVPLPSTFYQNTQYRIHYDEQLPKHTQFGKEFIYAFTWEDSECDRRLLTISPDDVVLCLTSAGDNLLDYLQACSPRRVHAVDLNPNQTHLLELKVASYQALSYMEFWALFGEGHCSGFRNQLLDKISPFLSSQALQFWLDKPTMFTSRSGLYSHGGSGVALKLVKFILYASGLSGATQRLCRVRSVSEQWQQWLRLRRVLLSRTLHWFFVNSDFLWRAAGVPVAQAKLISDDYMLRQGPQKTPIGANEGVWEYISDTLDPVARNTLLSEDNFYYLLVLNGRYTERCKPPYLSQSAFQKLSRPGAFDGLSMHTDEVCEVIERMRPGSLTLVVIMDSMDWFDPQGSEAAYQTKMIHRGLKPGGRVFLRSAALKPWYIAEFEKVGFLARRVGVRTPGSCIDRYLTLRGVNMYASAWIITKTAGGDGNGRDRPALA